MKTLYTMISISLSFRNRYLCIQLQVLLVLHIIKDCFIFLEHHSMRLKIMGGFETKVVHNGRSTVFHFSRVFLDIIYFLKEAM